MRHLVRFFRLPGTNTCTPIQNQGLSQIYSASPIRFIEALLHKCNYHTMSRFLDPQFIVNQSFGRHVNRQPNQTKTVQCKRKILAVILATAAMYAIAQPQPPKTARMIVAFPPGGGTDIVARVVAHKISENTGQPIVIDNRGGAAGIIGTELATKAAPDGLTLFMGTMGNFAVNPSLYPKLPFDVQRDLVAVTQVVSVLFVLYAHPSFPAHTINALIALARTRPGEIKYGNGGNGGAPHLSGALLESMARVKLLSVPYKGSGPAFIDLIGGHIPMAFDSGVQGIRFVKEGKLRALAVLSPNRSALLPDVPAMAETLPGYEVINWFALAAPTGTPIESINNWHSEVVRALKAPEVRDKLIAQGAEPIGSSPQEFSAFMKHETTKWARLIKEMGIQAN